MSFPRLVQPWPYNALIAACASIQSVLNYSKQSTSGRALFNRTGVEQPLF